MANSDTIYEAKSFLGRIYKIVASDPLFKEEHTYFGSTIKPVKERFRGHLSAYKAGRGTSARQIFDIYGANNCYIYQLEELDCQNIEDLRKKEAEYIVKYPCVNKVIPYMSKEERKKFNADYFRDYYINNEEYRKRKLIKMREYSAKYYQQKKKNILNN